MQSFPEIDRAAWFDLAEARVRVLASQLPFLDALERAIPNAGGASGASGPVRSA
jgi:predicted NUDIX family NTP pyrophosphohydrolase